MQTELPLMIAMSEKNYQLNYSESFTGNLHHFDSIIEGYQYSMSIDRAFESLLSQNYFSFCFNHDPRCFQLREKVTRVLYVPKCMLINPSKTAIGVVYYWNL